MYKDTTDIFINHPEITRISKGASKEDIMKVETLLKSKLPESYKEFLSQLGSAEFFGTFIAGLDNDNLIDSSIVLIQDRYRHLGIPKNLLIICDFEEFLYCLDLNSFDSSNECKVVSCYHLFKDSPYTEAFNNFHDFFYFYFEAFVEDYFSE